jgi:hypothetical protein
VLFIASACDVAKRFLDAGYGVVIDDVITPEDLETYRAKLAGRSEAQHFVALLPKLEVVLARAGRDETRMRALYERFERWTDVAAFDPGELAPELVADRVMALVAEGRALLSSA